MENYRVLEKLMLAVKPNTVINQLLDHLGDRRAAAIDHLKVRRAATRKRRNLNPLVPGDFLFEFVDESSYRGALWK